MNICKQILALFAILAVAVARQPREEAPTPYQFAFQEANSNHTLARQESGDAQGVVQGQYSYTDKNGVSRTVTYVADDSGFRADVKTNEPGTINSAPAGANYAVQ